MDEKATITFQSDSIREHITPLDYFIVIDGVVVETIGCRDTKVLQVSPGRHCIQIMNQQALKLIRIVDLKPEDRLFFEFIIPLDSKESMGGPGGIFLGSLAFALYWNFILYLMDFYKASFLGDISKGIDVLSFISTYWLVIFCALLPLIFIALWVVDAKKYGIWSNQFYLKSNKLLFKEPNRILSSSTSDEV
ncbi:MAG: hypothetical protein K2X66_06005 [Cyanobacteria bacterium]|nr:hypothetical protein [Cyanobacteriota bacterium]